MEQALEKQKIYGREEPLLSVLIPVYGTRDYIAKALDSVCGQTYRNLEIIVVNDASPDYAEDIILEYQAQDSRIRYIKNEENQGLFHARLRGYEAATGEYIACLDSDDYLGRDYYRSMLFTALREDADIVVSDFVDYDEEKKTARVRIANHLMSGLRLEGEAVFSTFLQTDFLVANWWFMWNKVYKKSLWDACYTELAKVDMQVTYLEDFLYGNVLLSRAKKLIHTVENSYFYVRHAGACTGGGKTPEEYYAHAQSKQYVFGFLRDYFEQAGLTAQTQAALDAYIGMHREGDLQKMNVAAGTKKEIEEYREKLEAIYGACEAALPQDTFYELTPHWDDRYEKLRELVCDEQVETVSFDIFDTLLLRPFYTPQDLFKQMDPQFESLCGQPPFASFSGIRIAAEDSARKSLFGRAPQVEEVALEEIYAEIGRLYDLPDQLLNRMMALEQELEVRYCTARKSMRSIYELARYLGKRVICISDIYLNRETILRMLAHAGYDGFDALYLSSEAGVTKRSGRLYHAALLELDAEPFSVLHIGDNWKSDIELARKKKMQAFFVPRAVECFENRIPPKQRGHYMEPVLGEIGGSWIRYKHALGHLGIRCMCAVVANRMFDNPFLTFHEKSDFNADPYFIGYFALGMHDFGMAKWVLDSAKREGCETIHFVARDGYAAKQVYDLLAQNDPDAPKSNYLYLSRKAMLPLAVRRRDDLFQLDTWINIKMFTPRGILELLGGLLPPITPQKETQLRRSGVLLDVQLRSREEYVHFARAVAELLYDQSCADAYRDQMRGYFAAQIGPHDAMFDIGYSGRGQAVLSDLLGYPVDAYYIHSLKDTAQTLARTRGFRVHLFYEHLPTITGRQREMIQSDTCPSCIGYQMGAYGLEPVLEEKTMPPMGQLIMRTIHRGMADFARNFLSVFHENLSQMYYSNAEVSFAHEYLMHRIKPADLHLFSQITFEDDMMEGFSQRKLSDIWAKDLKYFALEPASGAAVPARGNASRPPQTHNGKQQPNGTDRTLQKIYDSSRWKRIVYYLCFDHKTLNEKCRKFFGRGKRKKRDGAQIKKTPDVEKIKIPDKANTSFYYILSNYHLLCCIIHKLVFNRDRKAVVLLSAYRKNLYERLKQSGIFGDQIYLWDDSALNGYFEGIGNAIDTYSPKAYKKMNREVFRFVEERLPFPLSGFHDYYFSADHELLGVYAIHQGIRYSYFEDAAGILTRPEITNNNLHRVYSHAKTAFLSQFPVFGKNPKIATIYIKKSAQVPGVALPDNIVDIDVMARMRELPAREKDAILRVFDVKLPALDASKPVALLLTQQMYAFKKMSKLEQDRLYAALVDYFTQEHQLVVKPHPDDTYSDYRKLFPGCTVFEPKVLSEFLPTLLDVKYDKAITANSMAVYNLEQYVNTIVAFNPEIETTFKQFDVYYVASALAAKASAAGYRCVSSGINMLQANMLLANAGLDTDARFTALEDAGTGGKRCVFADTWQRVKADLQPDDVVILLDGAGEQTAVQVDIRRVPLTDTPLDSTPRRQIWINPMGQSLWSGTVVTKELTYTGVTLKCEIK